MAAVCNVSSTEMFLNRRSAGCCLLQNGGEQYVGCALRVATCLILRPSLRPNTRHSTFPRLNSTTIFLLKPLIFLYVSCLILIALTGCGWLRCVLDLNTTHKRILKLQMYVYKRVNRNYISGISSLFTN